MAQNLKLFKIYFSISVKVSLCYHRLDLLFIHRVTKTVHGRRKFIVGYQAVTVNVKHFEGLGNVLGQVSAVIHEKLDELLEVDASLVFVLVNIRDHGLEFSLRGPETMFSKNLIVNTKMLLKSGVLCKFFCDSLLLLCKRSPWLVLFGGSIHC